MKIYYINSFLVLLLIIVISAILAHKLFDGLLVALLAIY